MRCCCNYEVGVDTVRRDTDPLCDVHGVRKHVS